MTAEATSADAARHRVLEGVLLRLAGRADAAAFVVRGGVLLRHWFRPLPRAVEDLDLVATFPFDIADAARRFLPVLAEKADDGVTYDTERTRVEGIWLGSGNPGVRVFTGGMVGGTEIEFHVDLTFGPFPRPAPVAVALPTVCGEAARVWACRPEAVAGHKIQALWHRGLLGWRPKDLNDLHLLLARVPMDTADLCTAVTRYLADVGGTPTDARALFDPAAWWGTKLASARWLDFAASPSGQGVPRELTKIVAEVAGRLNPVLEGA